MGRSSSTIKRKDTMNADLTFNTIVFKKQWDDPDKGSSRQSVVRGINLPDQLTVRNNTFTDAATKQPGKQYVMRIDRWFQTAEGVRHKVSAYLVIQVPTVAASADVTSTVTTAKAAIADADLITNILNGEL